METDEKIKRPAGQTSRAGKALFDFLFAQNV